MFHYLFTCHLTFLNNHTLTHFNNDYHYLRLIKSKKDVDYVAHVAYVSYGRQHD